MVWVSGISAASAHKSACLARRFHTAAMVSTLHGESTLCRQLALMHASYGATQASQDAALPTLLPQQVQLGQLAGRSRPDAYPVLNAA